MAAAPTSADGLVWFITGTSTGLGRALVAAILARPSAPHDRVLATARDLADIADLADPRCHILELDVADPDPRVFARTADDALRVWRRVDVVVNNAGVGTPQVMEETGIQGFLHTISTNLFGTISVTNMFLPHMRARRSGTVLLLSSRTTFRSEIPMAGPYATSKAAVQALGEVLTPELRAFNIRICTVVPGGLDTGMQSPSNLPDYSPHAISPDYDPTRALLKARWGAVRPPGDPARAADRIVDLVRGEGPAGQLAETEGWPMWLFLGSDCQADVSARIDKVRRTLEAWKEVTRSIDYPEGE